MITVTLPWPPSKTSKNGSQGDYHGKARAARSYNQACAWECIAQGVRRVVPDQGGDVSVTVTYHPPTRARVDWDNMAGRAKQGFDAVAEAVGIDDGRWWPVLSRKGQVVKGGAIVVCIEA